jgi:hypothetical protein
MHKALSYACVVSAAVVTRGNMDAVAAVAHPVLGTHAYSTMPVMH